MSPLGLRLWEKVLMAPRDRSRYFVVISAVDGDLPAAQWSRDLSVTYEGMRLGLHEPLEGAWSARKKPVCDAHGIIALEQAIHRRTSAAGMR